MKSRLAYVLAITAFACGGDDPGNPAPTVVSTSPAEGAVDVPIDGAITITFSEPMSPGAGSITVDSGAGPERLTINDGAWNGIGNEVTFTLPAPLPTEREVTVVVETTFEDLEGATLEAPFELTFTTAPPVNPSVVSSTPEEGSTVSASLSEIVIVFSATMAQKGQVTLAGGPGTLGTPVWSADNTTITIPVSGLDYDTAYGVTLAGFADPMGDAVLPGVLVDLTLDFTTGPDTDAPSVVATNPLEGQADVYAFTTTFTVTFSEAMDTSRTTATITSATTTATLNGAWDAAGTMLTLTVPVSTMTYDTAYTVDLTPFTDVAGNPLDGGPVVGDGRLDFTTAEYVDIFPPYLEVTSPGEGATGVTMGSGTIQLVFSEAMNTSVTTLSMATSTGTTTISGSWSPAGQTFTLEAGILPPGAISIDVAGAGLTDEAGNPLDATIIIADGFLDFTVAPNSGENCSVPLYPVQGTPVAGGGTQFVVTASTLTGVDGSFSCDTTTHGPDFVIQVEKTTGTIADGGELLYVNVATSSTLTSQYLDFELLGGACNVMDPLSTQVDCETNRQSHFDFYDVPAGTYWIWVSKHSTGTWSGTVTVDVNEVTLGPGEWTTTAVPITGSGPISKVSTQRIGAPSCFPATGGEIDWYSYTPAASTILTITPDAPGGIALFNPAGAMMGCQTSGAGVGGVAAPETYFIAIESDSAISALTVTEATYTGVAGIREDTGITFPSSATGEYSMTTDGTSLFMNTTSSVWQAPLAGMTAATLHNSTSDGLTTAMLADTQLAFGAGGLWSVDDTTSTINPRVHRLWDGSSSPWMPVAWDSGSSYLANAIVGFAYDGTNLIAATDSTTNVSFYQIDPLTSGPALFLGTNTMIKNCIGLAADDEFLYLHCEAAGTTQDAIYRLSKADVTGTPMNLTGTLTSSSMSSIITNMAVDDLANPDNLYFKIYSPNGLAVIADPDGVAPVFLGTIATFGASGDYSMTVDRATGEVYMFDSSPTVDTIARVR